MNAIERSALRTLGQRDTWIATELPLHIGADTLMCLDADGLVEARCVSAINEGRNPDGSPILVRRTSEWLSPMASPHLVGRWDVILSRGQFGRWNLPHELRLTERGHSELSRITSLDPKQCHLWPEINAARTLAASFRKSGAAVFPGALVAICDGSVARRVIADSDFGQDSHQVAGCALWGACPEPHVGMALVEWDGGSGHVPVAVGDTERPATGVAQIDAWITRADVLRRLIRGSTETFVHGPLTDAQRFASQLEIYQFVREGAMSLLKEAPDEVRRQIYAVVEVADSADPTVEALDAAIRSLVSASPSWSVASLEPLNETQQAVWDELVELPPEEGCMAKQLVARLKLRKPSIEIEETTLRKHVIPALKKRGLKSKRGVGYYIDPGRRRSA